MKYQEHLVQRNGHRIYAREYPGDEPAIILLHGLPDNLHLYDRLVPYLSSRRRLVTFDFIGWGASDKPANYAYTAAHQERDLHAVVVLLPGARHYVQMDEPERVAQLILTMPVTYD